MFALSKMISKEVGSFNKEEKKFKNKETAIISGTFLNCDQSLETSGK